MSAEEEKRNPVVTGCAIALGLFFVAPVFLLIVGLIAGPAEKPPALDGEPSAVSSDAGAASLPSVNSLDASVTKEANPSVPTGETNPKATDGSDPTPEAVKPSHQVEEPPAKSSQPDPEARRQIRQAISKLVQRGRTMESLRQSDDPAILKRCGDEMRAAQAQAKRVHEQAKAFERDLAFKGLSGAANMVTLCVSCMRRANNTCDDVEDLLGMNKAINP